MLWKRLRPLWSSYGRSLVPVRYRTPAAPRSFQTFPRHLTEPLLDSAVKPENSALHSLSDQKSSSPNSFQDHQPETDDSPVTEPSHSSQTVFLRHAELLEKAEEYESLNATILTSGLIQSIRRQKEATFVHVSDGTTLQPMQMVLDPAYGSHLTNGSYIHVRGSWRKSLGTGQTHELKVERLYATGPSDPKEYPVQKKFQTQEYLRTIPHLRLRTPFHSLLARSRSRLLSDFQKSQYRSNVFQVQPPIITSSDCEGAGEVFTVTPRAGVVDGNVGKSSREYFREPKYLTVSSQLHLEAYAAELGDVYAISPTFRAEESDTPRHLSEFYMLEAEHRHCDSLNRLMKYVQILIQRTLFQFQHSKPAVELLQYYSATKRTREEDRVDLEQRWNALAHVPGRRRDWVWQRISHHEAVRELQTADKGSLFKTKPSFERGLQLEHERWIVENLGQGLPVFVTNYPKSAKPFYMLPSIEQLSEYGVETVACFDLLLPFGTCEVAGGSLREHRLENLIINMRERGMLRKRDPSKPAKDSDYPFLQPDEDLGPLRWYADLRRFGTSPHGGYGLGFDRLLAYLTGVSNLRDLVVFPRTWGRADC